MGLVSDLATCVVGSFTRLLCCSFLVVCLVPIVSHLFLPVWVSSDLSDAVLNDCESLSHLVILHVLLVVKFVGEFEQLVNLCLLILFHLALSLGPGRFLGALLALLARDGGSLNASL